MKKIALGLLTATLLLSGCEKNIDELNGVTVTKFERYNETYGANYKAYITVKNGNESKMLSCVNLECEVLRTEKTVNLKVKDGLIYKIAFQD